MKKLLFALTLLVAANSYAANNSISTVAGRTVTDLVQGVSDTVAAVSAVLIKAAGSIKDAMGKIPTLSEVKKMPLSVYSAGKAKTYALIEAAKKNPAYTAGAVAVTVAGVWALHKTYRYFVPKKAARA